MLDNADRTLCSKCQKRHADPRTDPWHVAMFSVKIPINICGHCLAEELKSATQRNCPVCNELGMVFFPLNDYEKEALLTLFDRQDYRKIDDVCGNCCDLVLDITLPKYTSFNLQAHS